VVAISSRRVILPFDEGVIWNQRAISFVEVAIERERRTCLWVIYRRVWAET
jgi:hypothetical protein